MSDMLSEALQQAYAYLVGQETAETMTGTVKWFNHIKGHGFIVPDDGQADCFAHYEYIESEKHFKDLEAGQRVTFRRVQTPKGPRAENIRVTE